MRPEVRAALLIAYFVLWRPELCGRQGELHCASHEVTVCLFAPLLYRMSYSYATWRESIANIGDRLREY